MANFIPSKKTAQDFNDGQKYIGYNPTTHEYGDDIEVEAINDLIESALYTQEQADSAKQTAQGALSEVNQVLADKTLLPDVQKNYYNLGAFDSFVSNGDGTGTITRSTGYLSPDDLLNLSWGNVYQDGDVFYISETKINGDKYSISNPEEYIIANTLELSISNIINDNFDGIAITHAYGIRFASKTSITRDEFLLNISNNKICVQYKLNSSYTEKVIENQPIHNLNQDGEQWLNNEWGKSLNLFNVNGTSVDNGASFSIVNDNTFQITRTGQSYSRVQFKLNLQENSLYHLSATSDKSARVLIWDDDLKEDVKDEYGVSSFDFNFVARKNTWVYFYSPNDVTTTYSNAMITESSHSYPYIPYNGKVIHEKDLSAIQIFPFGVNPAQTIGGDWEELGTLTTNDDNVLYAYRRL